MKVYRGYRSLPLAASGLIGIAAAWLQPARLGTADPIGFAIDWAAIGVAAGFVGSSEIIYNYVVHDDESGRRRTLKVVGQFLPSVVAGAAIAICFTHLGRRACVRCSRDGGRSASASAPSRRAPICPAPAGGLRSFITWRDSRSWIARGPEPLTGWWVGGVFGVGQLLGALVLWWNLERK